MDWISRFRLKIPSSLNFKPNHENWYRWNGNFEAKAEIDITQYKIRIQILKSTPLKLKFQIKSLSRYCWKPKFPTQILKSTPPKQTSSPNSWNRYWWNRNIDPNPDIDTLEIEISTPISNRYPWNLNLTPLSWLRLSSPLSRSRRKETHRCASESTIDIAPISQKTFFDIVAPFILN